MATDETLLHTTGERGRPILSIYGWDRPAISIGYVQDAQAVDADGHTLVRRPTGGGVVPHDRDLTYTVALPADHWLNGEDRMTSYHWTNRAVLEALAGLDLAGELSEDAIPRSVDRATMVCFTQPTRYDILCGGAKIAGSAQRRTRDGILHQGSVLLDAAGADKLDRESVATALPAGFESVLHAQFTPWHPPANFATRVDELARRKYQTDAWNLRRVPVRGNDA